MKTIEIVLASPSDLCEEREIVSDLVDEYNRTLIHHDFIFELRRWEDVNPSFSSSGPQGIIDIDLNIQNADIFICIYWEHIGTNLPGKTIAGTEHELEIALKSFESTGKPDIKVFFKKITDNAKDHDIIEIKRIESYLQPKGLYKTYENKEQFKKTINKILFEESIASFSNPPISLNNSISIEYIECTNAFSQSLGSNKKMYWKQGLYDILDNVQKNDHIVIEEVFDGHEVVISNIQNFELNGNRTTLLVSPRYAHVLTFRNCRNISISGFVMGHTPRKGDCIGGVVRFEHCDTVSISNSEFFGCGTCGIELHACKNIFINGIKIYECTYNGIVLSDSEINFENSMIYECNTYGSIVEAQGSFINLNNIAIFENIVGSTIFTMTDSILLCKAVSVFNNKCFGATNGMSPVGINYYDNEMNHEVFGYPMTIENNGDIENPRKEFEETVEICLNYGEIKRTVFDNGKFEILVECLNHENMVQLSQIYENNEKVVISYG